MQISTSRSKVSRARSRNEAASAPSVVLAVVAWNMAEAEDGLYVWEDAHYVEVVDPDRGAVVLASWNDVLPIRIVIVHELHAPTPRSLRDTRFWRIIEIPGPEFSRLI